MSKVSTKKSLSPAPAGLAVPAVGQRFGVLCGLERSPPAVSDPCSLVSCSLACVASPKTSGLAWIRGGCLNIGWILENDFLLGIVPCFVIGAYNQGVSLVLSLLRNKICLVGFVFSIF